MDDWMKSLSRQARLERRGDPLIPISDDTNKVCSDVCNRYKALEFMVNQLRKKQHRTGFTDRLASKEYSYYSERRFLEELNERLRLLRAGVVIHSITCNILDAAILAMTWDAFFKEHPRYEQMADCFRCLITQTPADDGKAYTTTKEQEELAEAGDHVDDED